MSLPTTWTTMLVTGLRGNAKSLMAVGMMDRFIKAGVPTFAANFNELTLPGVQFLEDPREWQTLPAGSVLFVDEAQRFWRTRAGNTPVPENLIAMETQRHNAVRIVALTQDPTFLDKHFRRLVDSHVHLIRRAGMKLSQRYTWERCKDEPENPAVVELADKDVYNFETEYFGTYKSAEEHHIKRKLPARLKWMAAGLVGAVLLGWWAVDSLRAEPSAVVESEVVPSNGAAVEGSTDSRRERRPLRTDEYLARMVPRVEGALWSAPIYDEANEVQEAPQVVCMIGSRCRCITTQGTAYAMEPMLCRKYVLSGGILNPFKRPAREDRGRVEGGTPATAMDAAASAPSPEGAGEAVEQQASYGAFRG